MKKFLFLAVFSILTFAANAQSTVTLENSGDTATNGATLYLTGNFSANFANFKQMAIQVYVDKVSGTTGGSITIEGSVDGVRWKALKVVNTTMTDTLTDSDMAYVYTFPAVVPYVRVNHTQSGTQVNIVTAKAYLKY